MKKSICFRRRLLKSPVLCLALIAIGSGCSDEGSDSPSIGAFPNEEFEQETASSSSDPAHFIALDVNTIADSASKAFLETVFRAFSSDPRLAASTIRASAQSAKAISVASPWRPELTASAQSYNSGLTLQASQPIFDFGKRRAEVAEIKAEQASEEFALSQERERLLREALLAVLDYNDAQARIDLHQRQIRDFEDARVAAERLASMNMLTAAAVRLAQVERQKAEIDLMSAKRDADIARTSWSNIAGETAPPSEFEPSRIKQAMGIDSEEKTERVFAQHNLRLRGFGVRQSILEAEAKSVSLSRTPTISAALEATVGGASDDTNMGVSVAYPVFRKDPAEDLAEVRAAISAIGAESNATRRNLQVELENLHQRALSSRSLARAQRASLAVLEQRVVDLKYLMEKGLATYTDLIEAREDIFDTELEILAHQNTARRADAEILLLTGVLIP